jgi:hypothetical protein
MTLKLLFEGSSVRSIERIKEGYGSRRQEVRKDHGEARYRVWRGSHVSVFDLPRAMTVLVDVSIRHHSIQVS